MAEGTLLRSPHADLGAAAATQLRVVCALMLRDVQGRSTWSALGYVWAVLSPVVKIAFLTLLGSTIRDRMAPLGESLPLFLATGVLPFQLFSTLDTAANNVVVRNSVLFTIPVVKPIDAIVAKLVLTMLISMAAIAIIFTGLWFLELGVPPREPLRVAEGFAAMALLGVGIGLINANICRFFPAWDRFWSVITMPLFILSGIMYVPDLMPQQIIDILVWNPVLHGIEWFRSGFYPNYGERTLDRGYLLSWGLTTVLVGLAAERALRARARADDR